MSGDVVHHASDVRVLAAASGMRPHVDDAALLEERVYKFAPNGAAYKVQKDGSGTFVYLHGTDACGRSCAVRAEGFRPYLYVGLDWIDAQSDDESARNALITQLIEELQVRLVAIVAEGQRMWAPERVVVRRAVAGEVAVDWRRCEASLAQSECGARPIVDWRISYGIPVKGSGENAGYRGVHERRFLQIFFYSPTLVNKCRALLQGVHAELGAAEQCARLARGERADAAAAEAASAAADAADGCAPSDAQQQQWQKQTDTSGFRLFRPSPRDVLDERPDGKRDAAQALLGEIEEFMEQEGAERDALAGDDENADDWEPDDKYDAQVLADASESGDDDSGGGGGGGGENCDTTRRYKMASASKEDPVVLALEKRLERRFARRVAHLLRRAAARGANILDEQRFAVYEADIDFVLRFAIDCGFSYEQWLELDLAQQFDAAPDGTPLQRPSVVRRVRDTPHRRSERETFAQLEFRVDYRALRCRADDPIQNTMPRHLLLSLDCEMQTGPQMAFPQPQTESMLQCVCIVRDDRTIPGRPPPTGRDAFWYRSVSFVLGDGVETQSAPRTNCWERHVLCFASEAVLFEALARFVRELAPSLVTGYNTDGFDLPYMLARSERLGVGKQFANAWGRSRRASRLRIREHMFESSAFGKIVFQDVSAEGVVFLDLFLKLKKDPANKMRSLTLNNVAAHLLGEQKEDVAYSMINVLQRTAAGRETLRLYCEKDALLPLQIFAKMQIVPSMVEMARINGCTMEHLLKRGQQVRARARAREARAKKKKRKREKTNQRDSNRRHTATMFSGGLGRTGICFVGGERSLSEAHVSTSDWSFLSRARAARPFNVHRRGGGADSRQVLLVPRGGPVCRGVPHLHAQRQRAARAAK